MYGVCNNHSLRNGNKRTALVAGIVHLDKNGYVLDGVDGEELFRLMRRIADHHFSSREHAGIKQPKPDEEITAISGWLTAYARRVTRGDHSISYGQVYEIVQGFGFVLGEKRDNLMDVLVPRRGIFGLQRHERVFRIACPGDSRMAPVNEIKQLRRALRLDESNGVDSYSFYGPRTVIDDFIVRHRTVLKKLAKI